MNANTSGIIDEERSWYFNLNINLWQLLIVVAILALVIFLIKRMRK
jgi:hypothetical protein